jgi:MATE family multidrug resistance protein
MNAPPSQPAYDENSWWRRESGGREVLQVAFPLVVSTLSWTIMTYVDRTILSYYSPITMSAAFSSAVVWFAFFCVFMGTCSYVNTFVAQYYGDNQPERIGSVVWQGNWLAALSIPFAAIVYPLAPLIFSFAGHSPEVTEQEIIYFQILCLGGPGMAIAEAQSCFYSGRGMTWVVMLVDLVTTVINLAIDIVLIFGYFGFPELGIAGAAWGTVIGLWLKAVVYFFLLRQETHCKQFRTQNWKFDKQIFGRLVYFGGPGGVQMLLDVAGFSVFVLLIGRLGNIETQATTMAFSINTVSFMPVWGLGIATAILVGQRLGENRDDLAARATWTTYQIGMAYMAAISLLYVAWPGLFVEPFLQNAELSPADKESLHRMALMLLYFVAAYNMFDATQIIFVSALKGAGDTRFIMLMSLSMATTLAIMSYLAVEVFHFNVYGCWVLIVVWLIVMAAAYFLRFLTGRWRHMRVIDQVHHSQGTTHNEEQAALACTEA